MDNGNLWIEFWEKAEAWVIAFDRALKGRLQEIHKIREAFYPVFLEYGWFPGLNDGFSSLSELVERLNAQGTDVDAVMADYYRSNFSSFSEELLVLNADRKAPLEAALKAHREGEYYLSIPVFIAQADGIQARLDKTAIKEKFKGDETKILENLKLWLEDRKSVFMLHPKERKEHEEKTGKTFNFLNRHQVMHGESFDYGTEANSLKAFSYLFFVGVHIPAVLKQ